MHELKPKYEELHAKRQFYENNRHIGGGGPGNHVAGVLSMPRGVRDDKLAPWSREITLSDINSDALFPLGPQPISQKRQINMHVTPLARTFLNRLELILKDRF